MHLSIYIWQCLLSTCLHNVSACNNVIACILNVYQITNFPYWLSLTFNMTLCLSSNSCHDWLWQFNYYSYLSLIILCNFWTTLKCLSQQFPTKKPCLCFCFALDCTNKVSNFSNSQTRRKIHEHAQNLQDSWCEGST